MYFRNTILQNNFQENNNLYEDTLEPQYISVDLTEVELVENENGPRENHTVLLDVSTYSEKNYKD